jgi:hypothetical protein
VKYFAPDQILGSGYFASDDVPSESPPEEVEEVSEGHWYVPSDRPRRLIREDRERLGIIPKRVKKVIEVVAKATVAQEKTDTQANAVLARKLEQQEIEVQARYTEAMQIERDRILARDITRALAIKRRQKELDDEDEREVQMLLM